MGPFLQVQLGTTEALALMFTLVWSVFYAMGQAICNKVRWNHRPEHSTRGRDLWQDSESAQNM